MKGTGKPNHKGGLARGTWWKTLTGGATLRLGNLVMSEDFPVSVFD